MGTALDKIKMLLTAFFVQHDLDTALSTLHPHVYVYGLANDVVIEGLEQGKAFLNRVRKRGNIEYELLFYDENNIDKSCAELGFSLGKQDIQVKYRVTAVLKEEEGEEKLSLLHFSIIRPEHRPSLFPQLLKEDLLADIENAVSVAMKYGHMGLWTYNLDTRKLEQLFTRSGFYGYSLTAENVPDSYIRDGVIHRDDADIYRKCYQDILDGKAASECRVRVFDQKRGAYFWTRICLVRQTDIRDGMRRAIGISFDIDIEVVSYEELQRDEKLMEMTCRLANIWMFQYDPQSRSVHVAKNLQEDYQVPAVIENYPDAFFKYPVIPPENHELYRQMVRKAEADEDATTEMQVRMAGGALCWVRFEWYVTRREEGKPAEITGVAMDITHEMTERSRIEKERQKILGGDKKLTAYSITDLQKETIIEAQDYYLKSAIAAGDTCEEFNAKLAPLLIFEEDRRRFLEMRDPGYALKQYDNGITGWSEDLRWKGVNGYVRWQRSVYSIVQNGYTGALYLYCYLYDVLDEKVMLDLFSGIQKNLYLKTGVLSLKTGQLYDYDGDYINGKLKISDYDTARKKYVMEHVLPEDGDQVLARNAMPNIREQLHNNPNDFSFVHREMADGKLRYRQVRYAMVPEKTDFCICVVRDITDIVEEIEQKNTALQKALLDAQTAAQAKSEFLSRMSHEIRTPMNAIMGMTAIAQDNKSDFLQVSDCLSRIASSSRYLLTLINDILEMSRIESGRTKLLKEKFDFAELIRAIRTVMEPLAKKNEIRLEILNRTGNGSYYGDHIRMEQVMISLIGNAIKFTKKSGRVRFEVSAVKDTDTMTVFEFLIEDTGIGMSEEFMQKMFEPFVQEDSSITSKYGGSGLGLAISKSLVEAMGGTIKAESMLGFGTNFAVKIPLERAQSTILLRSEATEAMSAADMDKILSGKHILMAEDHPMNVMVAKKLLERKGLIITVAENGKIAVDIFRNSAPEEYDAILMDIRMPVMDGLEATRQIRALERPDAKMVPIIAMTANALEEDRNNSKAAGMNDHLAKPIDPKTMYQSLAKQMARRKA